MLIYADLHIHSCLSPCADMDMTPMNICAMAKIKGLQVISVTDHNSAANLPAADQAARKHGLLLLPGIEITTREEVHLLAYFPTVDQALAMGDFLYSHLPNIQTNSRIFGQQCIMGDDDKVIRLESRLLISAVDISLRPMVEEIEKLGGFAIPAHINRGGNGLLVNLGLMPDDIHFPAVEVSKDLPIPYNLLEGKVVLHSSDAHQLGAILEQEFTMDISDLSPTGILSVLGYHRLKLF